MYAYCMEVTIAIAHAVSRQSQRIHAGLVYLPIYYTVHCTVQVVNSVLRETELCPMNTPEYSTSVQGNEMLNPVNY